MKAKLTVFSGIIGIILLLFLSCGNEPPPPFFAGDGKDSAAIKELLTNEVLALPLFEDTMFGRGNFLVGVELKKGRYLDTLLKMDRPFMKFFPKAFGRKKINQRDSFNIIFIKDTTCHVYLIREFRDSLYILTDSVTPYLPDSGYYASYFVAKETLIVKPFNGISWQVAFFEPIKKDTEPRVWKLKKISGCQIISSPDAEKAPIFFDQAGGFFGVVISSPTKTCTVFQLEYQRTRDLSCSLKFSNRRLFYVEEVSCEKKDSLLYLPTDSLKVSCHYWLNPDDSVYTFVYYKDKETKKWQRILSSKKFVLPEGFNRFYVEGITYEALTHIKKEPRAIIWGIATRVK
ncbi:MAG: hypothetical protein N2323_02870 [candidate division WOR-3 bacterium]|nr:hypothetical protein [candidate division WOR-3 bacterium]